MHKKISILAKDFEDIAILSGLVQDSIFPFNDMKFDKKKQTFLIALNRFCWEGDNDKPPHIRTHAILMFETVVAVQTKTSNNQNLNSTLNEQNIAKMNSILSLLPSKQKNGNHYIYISLASSDIVRIEIKEIRITLKDVGSYWKTNFCPKHENCSLK